MTGGSGSPGDESENGKAKALPSLAMKTKRLQVGQQGRGRYQTPCLHARLDPLLSVGSQASKHVSTSVQASGSIGSFIPQSQPHSTVA